MWHQEALTGDGHGADMDQDHLGGEIEYADLAEGAEVWPAHFLDEEGVVERLALAQGMAQGTAHSGKVK